MRCTPTGSHALARLLGLPLAPPEASLRFCHKYFSFPTPASPHSPAGGTQASPGAPTCTEHIHSYPTSSSPGAEAMLVCRRAPASAPPGAGGSVGARQTSVFSSETEGSQGFRGPAPAKSTTRISSWLPRNRHFPVFSASASLLPRGLSRKESASRADTGDSDLIPRSGRPPGGGNGSPFQDSCQKISWTEESDELQSVESQNVRQD